MVVTHQLDITCTKASDCSDAILARLGHDALAFNLKATRPADIVHGSVTIAHGSPHIITVEVYERNEPPTPVRQSTLQRPVPMPTVAALKQRLG